MSKEWILNMATNRWGLNKKDKVGPVAKWIREAAPKTIRDWEKYYYNKLKEEILEPKKLPFENPQDYLENLGRKLYVKISEVIKAEICEVSDEDCIQYIKELVLSRTFKGYLTEKETIFEHLDKKLNIKILPAPDQWDRTYNVDFYIQVGNKYIGLQIKPISYEHTPEIHKWLQWLSDSHEKFHKKYGGKVFVIFSYKDKNGRKIIHDEENVLKQIREEIERLNSSG
ncbi:MjaI family restriction endonuclease [Pseudothermotoga sp. U03pept]|uniref:MjaI family restriction endonuclease n=1 Tax=Pseudothermotoga sp. U03pept TaxID=3447012 RepID=UPI003F06AD28